MRELIAPGVWLVTPEPRQPPPELRPNVGDPEVHIERAEDGGILAVYEVRRVRYSSPEEALSVVEAAGRRGVRVSP